MEEPKSIVLYFNLGNGGKIERAKIPKKIEKKKVEI